MVGNLKKIKHDLDSGLHPFHVFPVSFFAHTEDSVYSSKEAADIPANTYSDSVNGYFGYPLFLKFPESGFPIYAASFRCEA